MSRTQRTCSKPRGRHILILCVCVCALTVASAQDTEQHATTKASYVVLPAAHRQPNLHAASEDNSWSDFILRTILHVADAGDRIRKWTLDSPSSEGERTPPHSQHHADAQAWGGEASSSSALLYQLLNVVNRALTRTTTGGSSGDSISGNAGPLTQPCGVVRTLRGPPPTPGEADTTTDLPSHMSAPGGKRPAASITCAPSSPSHSISASTLKAARVAAGSPSGTMPTVQAVGDDLCANGYVALPKTEHITCSLGTLTGEELAARPMADVVACLSTAVQPPNPYICLCSLDAARMVGTAEYCEFRMLNVAMTTVGENTHCSSGKPGEELGIPPAEGDFCLSASRGGLLNIPVNTTYRWYNDDESLNYLASQSNPPRRAEPFDPATIFSIVGSVLYGTYDHLEMSSGLFHYLILPGHRFSLTAAHPLATNGQFFELVYSFSRPDRLREHYYRWYLNSQVTMNYFLNRGGTTLGAVSLDFAILDDEFIEGNQVYMEAGFAGGGIPDTHRVGRFWFHVEDIPEPQNNRSYGKPFSPLYTLIIVVVVIVVGGLVAAVVWCLCRRVGDSDEGVTRKGPRELRERKHVPQEEGENM